MSAPSNRRALGLAALVAFVDMVGFSVIFPLFPAMLTYYLELEGGGGALGQLVAELEALTDGERFAVVALFGGVLGSLYSALQFAFAPLWGTISDRVGRRRVLLITLTGTVLSYVVWVFANSFALLVVARLVGGAMAGNVSTASAVVADVTDAKDRAKGMGMLGAAIGMGFLFGPAIGGMFASVELDAAAGAARGFALNPFSVPAIAATVLAVVNLLMVAARLPETLPPERRGSSDEARTWNPFRQLARLSFPGVARTNVVYFLFLVAFSAMEFTLVFLAADRLGYGPTDNAWLFVFAGLVIALVQGGVVRRLAPRVGEKKLSLVGLGIVVPGFCVIAFAQSSGLLYAGVGAMAVGSALVMPCLSALVSRYTPDDRQGLALGTFRSMGSLSRALGPVLGGLLYWRFGSAAPYLSGAVFLLVPLALALALPAPGRLAGSEESA